MNKKEIQYLKDELAKEVGYLDWDELLCIEDGPMNPEDVDSVVTKLILSTTQWNLSRKKMPDFDAEYLVAGWMHYECGNVVQFQKVVTCKFNQWVKSDIGEQMTYWRELPPMPKEEDTEDEIK